MKQWVSILGEVYTAMSNADGAPPPPVSTPPFVKKSDDKMEGTYSVENNAFFPLLVTLAGKRSRIAELRGKVVSGVRMALKAQVMRSRYSIDVQTHSINTSTFTEGTLTSSSIVARIAFDIPGGGDFPSTAIGWQVTTPAPSVRISNGKPEWYNVSPKWSWDNTPDGYPYAYIENYVPKNLSDDPPGGYAIGKFQDELIAPSLPFGYVRFDGDQISVGAFGGGVGALLNVEPNSAGYIQFTKLELLVSEPPTWAASAPLVLTVGSNEDEYIEITAKYPVGNEPLVGLKIKLKDATSRVSMRTAAGQWVHEGVFTTDSQGKIKAKVRGEAEGAAAISISDGGNQSNMTYLMEPPLKGTATVFVSAEASSPPPPDPPPTPDPVETNCVSYPAIPGVPAVPPKIVREDIVGWNSGAVSVDLVTGTADLQFALEAVNIGAVIGLTTRDEVIAPGQLFAGFYFSKDRYGNPQFQFIEGGKTKGDPIECEVDDTFRITLVDGVLRYYHDDEKVRTGKTDVSGIIRAGAGLYKSGDALPSSSVASEDDETVCFWDNLVQAEQECESAPSSGQSVVFLGLNGDGHGSGGLIIILQVLAPGEEEDSSVCNETAMELLFAAESVEVTGLAPFVGEVEDAVCGLEAPTSGYDDVSYVMTQEALTEELDWLTHWFESSGDGPEQGLYWARVLVNGTTEIFGILDRGGGV